MIDMKKFGELKNAVDKWRKERDKAEGALSQLLSTLKDEYGCSSVEDAEAKIDELLKEVEDLERKFNDMMNSFEARWSDELKKFGGGS